MAPVRLIANIYQHALNVDFEFSTECDSNTFGEDCGEECGSCVDSEQCHHINGTCLNGCERGFQGIECNQGNTFSFLADHFIGNLSFHIHK